MSAAVLTAAQVAEMLGYKTRRIHELYRAGHLPGPIDDTLSTVSWRWSPNVIAAYIAGDWKADR